MENNDFETEMDEVMNILSASGMIETEEPSYFVVTKLEQITG